jgi:F-type H+-transporting ATPase subunit delta
MTESKVAVRYSKSLTGLAQEQGVLDSVNKDMELIERTIRKSRELAALLKNPTVKTEKKLNILNQLFADKVHKLSLSFLNIITRKKRSEFLFAITVQFQKMFKQLKGIETVVITSAIGLDDRLRKEVIELARKGSNSEIELIENVDKRLIGGFILRMGDVQYDASILRNLRKFSKELHSNIYLKQN